MSHPSLRFFLSDFTAFLEHDFYEKVSPKLYARLRHEERVRLFVAQENLGYIITLSVMSKPDSESGLDDDHLKRILPDAIASKLNRSRLVEGSAEFHDRKELLKELSDLETAILEARPLLVRRNLEQSPGFLKRLKRFEQDPDLGYRVRASVIERDVKHEPGPVRFAAGQKVLRVETPILIGILLVKDAGRFKILALEPADDD